MGLKRVTQNTDPKRVENRIYRKLQPNLSKPRLKSPGSPLLVINNLPLGAGG